MTAFFAVALTTVSCIGIRGSGIRAEDTRLVPPFSAIEINGGYHLEIEVVPGLEGEVSLHLSGDDNLLPLVKTECIGGNLEIGSDEALSSNLPLTVTARTGELKSIEINGSAEGRIVGLSGDKVTLGINGSGELVLTGKVRELELEVAGSGEITANEVQAETVSIDVAGSGEVKVCATGKLKVDIAGSGRVEYYCNPAELEKSIAGSGELIRK